MTNEAPPSGRYSTLCRPDDEKSCFGCCPPIRPANYDHLDHRLFLRRELWANTRHATTGTGKTPRPIVGYTCWGLGYLDARHIGCLLHPCRNQGHDLRDLTGYGDKCRRELCREAVIFSQLTDRQTSLVMGLTDGLDDAFEYSSPKANPAFRLLRWGPVIIDALAQCHPGELERSDYLEKYQFLARDLDPETYRFPLEIWIEMVDWTRVTRPESLDAFTQSVTAFIARYRSKMTPPLDNRPYVHQLDIPKGFATFLKTALGLTRLRPSQAREILAALTRRLSVPTI